MAISSEQVTTARKAIKIGLVVVGVWTLLSLWRPCMKMVITQTATSIVEKRDQLMRLVGCDVSLEDYARTTTYKLTHVPACLDPVCDLNNGRHPVQRLDATMTCIEARDCITALVKTKHRISNVQTFIKSLHKYYPGVRVIIADEIDPDFNIRDIPIDWLSLNSTEILYFQVHAGVGYGRQMAARLAVTPYILIADDDFVVTDQTNLLKLVSVLSTTDVAIVGGSVNDKFPYDGAIRVMQARSTLYRPHLVVYPGIFYEVVPCHHFCYVCDIIKNFFLADREAIIKAEGWDITRLYYEHEDFFFQMRKSHVKVAHCRDVVINHTSTDRQLARDRKQHFQEWSEKLKTKWGFEDYYYCSARDYYHLDDCDRSGNFA